MRLRNSNVKKSPQKIKVLMIKILKIKIKQRTPLKIKIKTPPLNLLRQAVKVNTPNLKKIKNLINLKRRRSQTMT